MPIEQLRDYTKTSRQAGKTDDEIRKELLDMGFPEHDVDDAISGQGPAEGSQIIQLKRGRFDSLFFALKRIFKVIFNILFFAGVVFGGYYVVKNFFPDYFSYLTFAEPYLDPVVTNVEEYFLLLTGNSDSDETSAVIPDIPTGREKRFLVFRIDVVSAKTDKKDLKIVVTLNQTQKCQTSIEHDLIKVNDTIKLTLLSVVENLRICASDGAKPQFFDPVSLANGIYSLEFYRGTDIDIYQMTVADDSIKITPQKSVFTWSDQLEYPVTPGR